MPAEPELPDLEAMLRDAARLRREAFDAAGPGAATMPGPTRARLHKELARRFDGVPVRGATSSGGLMRWWLAFAGAAGAAAVFAMFIVANQTAQERPAAVAARSTPAAPPHEVAALPAPPYAVLTPAASPAPQAEVARDSVATRQDQPPADAASIALSKAKDAPGYLNAPPVSAAVLRAQTFTQSPLPLAAAPMKEDSLARRAIPTAPVAAPAPGARGGAAATGQAGSARPAPPSLLGNFRFEQRGDSVRVVDADGSVYVGQVEADKAPASQAQGTLRADKATPADAVGQSQDASAGGENFRFRATGDNRTLRKPVVFEGEYTAPLPEVANGAKLESKTANSQPAPNSEAQIRGRVRVLDGRSGQRGAEVDARAVDSR